MNQMKPIDAAGKPIDDDWIFNFLGGQLATTRACIAQAIKVERGDKMSPGDVTSLPRLLAAAEREMAPVQEWIEARIPPDPWGVVHSFYQDTFDKMHEIPGTRAEFGTLRGDLNDAADKALVVFRDLLEASVSAKAGVYRSVEDPDNPIEGVDSGIEHAEHELGMLVSAIRRAKSALAMMEGAERTEPTPSAPKGRRRAPKAERSTS
jgi:hypothetical protein